MTAGQWHRLDNVFAILGLQLMCVHLLPRAHVGASVREVLCWSAVALTTWAQEAGPWRLSHTVVPIAVFAAPLLVWRPRLGGAGRAWTLAMIGSLAVAVLAFAKGLDDERDYLRMWHGLWHVAASSLTMCLLVLSAADHRENHDKQA